MISVFAFYFILLENVWRPAQSRVKPQPNTQQTQQQPQADKRGTLDAPFVVKPLRTEKNQQEADEDARDKNEKRWNDRITIFVAVATAIILFLQLIVFGRQARRLKQTIEAMKKIGADQSKDMQGWIAVADKSAEAAKQAADAAMKSVVVAEKTLSVTQRPWIRVDVAIGGPLVNDINGANFTFDFILENIGNSPARNVWPDFKVVLLNSGEIITHFDAREIQIEMIEDRKNIEHAYVGHTIFPKEKITQQMTYTSRPRF